MPRMGQIEAFPCPPKGPWPHPLRAKLRPFLVFPQMAHGFLPEATRNHTLASLREEKKILLRSYDSNYNIELKESKAAYPEWAKLKPFPVSPKGPPPHPPPPPNPPRNKKKRPSLNSPPVISPDRSFWPPECNAILEISQPTLSFGLPYTGCPTSLDSFCCKYVEKSENGTTSLIKTRHKQIYYLSFAICLWPEVSSPYCFRIQWGRVTWAWHRRRSGKSKAILLFTNMWLLFSFFLILNIFF